MPDVKQQATRDRRKLFAAEYTKDFRPGRAYERAGYGAKGKAADAAGHKLLKDEEVQEFIRAEMEAMSRRNQLEQDAIVQEYMRIAFSDIKDYMEWGPSGLEWKSSADLTENQSRAIDYVEFFEDKTKFSHVRRYKFKLHSKTVALEALSKYLGLFEKDNRQKDLLGDISGISELLDYARNNVISENK